jgi:hypothetical protein
MASQLIQIYYDDAQLSKIFPFAIPHHNPGLTIYFENTIIARLVPETKAQKIGVCSWKLKEKLRWNVPGPTKARELTQEVIESNYDVLSFTKNSHHHRMIEALNWWHPGSLPALDRMLGIIGLGRASEVKNPIYQNAFMARTEIYKDYVKNYLNKAIEAIESDGELMKMMMADSKYTTLAKINNAELLKTKLGIDYYPLCPFILERLFSIYVQNKGIKVSYL